MSLTPQQQQQQQTADLTTLVLAVKSMVEHTQQQELADFVKTIEPATAELQALIKTTYTNISDNYEDANEALANLNKIILENAMKFKDSQQFDSYFSQIREYMQEVSSSSTKQSELTTLDSINAANANIKKYLSDANIVASNMINAAKGISASAAKALPSDISAVAAAAKVVAADSLFGIDGKNVDLDVIALTGTITSALSQTDSHGDSAIMGKIASIIQIAVQLVADTVAANTVDANDGVVHTIAPDFSKLLCCKSGGLLKMYEGMKMNMHPVEVTSSLNTVVTINENHIRV